MELRTSHRPPKSYQHGLLEEKLPSKKRKQQDNTKNNPPRKRRSTGKSIDISKARTTGNPFFSFDKSNILLVGCAFSITIIVIIQVH